MLSQLAAASWSFAGLTALSDWIGSNPGLVSVYRRRNGHERLLGPSPCPGGKSCRRRGLAPATPASLRSFVELTGIDHPPTDVSELGCSERSARRAAPRSHRGRDGRRQDGSRAHAGPPAPGDGTSYGPLLRASDHGDGERHVRPDRPDRAAPLRRGRAPFARPRPWPRRVCILASASARRCPASVRASVPHPKAVRSRRMGRTPPSRPRIG